MTLVMNNYLTAPEMDQVMDGAIRGMLEALDPDSVYLDAEEYLAFKDPEAHKKAGHRRRAHEEVLPPGGERPSRFTRGESGSEARRSPQVGRKA